MLVGMYLLIGLVGSINFSPGRKWIFGGSFRPSALVNGSSVGYFTETGAFGSFGFGTYNSDGVIHSLNLDDQTNLYVAGDFTHMINGDGSYAPMRGVPVALWPYNPLYDGEWIYPFGNANIEFEKNDLYQGASEKPVVYDVFSDCYNLVTTNGLACDVYVAGEFKVSSIDTIAAGAGDGYTYNLFKYDAMEQKFDFLLSTVADSSSLDRDYFYGPVKSLYKKSFEPNVLTTWFTDKKLWVGGHFPYGFGMISLWDANPRKYYRVSPQETMIVNSILYRYRWWVADDEIWVGGNFQFETPDGKLIKNIGNFNHKVHQTAEFTVNGTTSPWETWGVAKAVVEKWPESESGLGVMSVGGNQYQKFISGYDLVCKNCENQEYTGREPWQGLFTLNDGESHWKSPNKALNFEATFVKHIDVCESEYYGCVGSSVLIVGGGGFVKYLNMDSGENGNIENFGENETPFGTDDVLETCFGAYMLSSASSYAISSFVLIFLFFFV